eukprot:scaffold74966_cov32-Prasinocladus_malaysianus.AAC.1
MQHSGQRVLGLVLSGLLVTLILACIATADALGVSQTSRLSEKSLRSSALGISATSKEPERISGKFVFLKFLACFQTGFNLGFVLVFGTRVLRLFEIFRLLGRDRIHVRPPIFCGAFRAKHRTHSSPEHLKFYAVSVWSAQILENGARRCTPP